MASSTRPRPSASPHPVDGRERNDRSLLDELRPLPPESPWERIRRSFLERSMGDDRSAGLGDEGLTSARQRSWAARVVAALVVVLVGAVGWWLLRPPPAPVELSMPTAGGEPGSPGGAHGSGEASGSGAVGISGASIATSAGGSDQAVASGQAAEETSTEPTQLVVHASGAVASPGVYRLPVGARVDDLVRAAGGLTADGDGDRVNLAALLSDGERVWVPRRGETDAPVVVAGGGTGSAPGAGGPTGGTGTSVGGATDGGPLVDLNTATAADLETLPGVGPATAAAILAYRDQNGPFRAVDDLIEVRGIGEAKLEQIRPLVRT